MAGQPEVTVAVDLGTTCSAVAWMTGQEPPTIINDWPGSGDSAKQKVPSSLIYGPDSKVAAWGFLCDDMDPWDSSLQRRDLFKLRLDDDALPQQQVNAPVSVQEARRCTIDYLCEVYAHVKKTVQRDLKSRRYAVDSWDQLPVLFLFSVPTTWTRLRTVKLFQELIRKADFGLAPSHDVQVNLTEAEAAAVATLKTDPIRFSTGSLFLTIDAGGGTTDLALLHVTSANPRTPQINQVSAVRGIGIGSTHIDEAFARLVTQRRAACPDIQDTLPPGIDARMARSHQFLSIKHKFGQSVHMLPSWRITMDGVAHTTNHPKLGIEKGCLVVTQEEIKSLFDPQIEAIKSQISKQLDWLYEEDDKARVNNVILSGGLGASAYVRERLQHHLNSFSYRNLPQGHVISSQEPQLVVVRGLLHNLQQTMQTGGHPVLAKRIARASYGVVIQQLYNRNLHSENDLVLDPFDSSVRWATNQIRWLIRKGHEVECSEDKPLVKSFEIRLAEQEVNRSWSAEIVISHNDAESLPYSLRQAVFMPPSGELLRHMRRLTNRADGVVRLCQVKSNLDGLQQHELTLKKKRGARFWKQSKFYVCQLQVLRIDKYVRIPQLMSKSRSHCFDKGHEQPTDAAT